MKKYIIALMVIAGCSGPTESDDSFEPYRIGTWLMTTETSAEWVGIQGAAKMQEEQGDTVYVTSTDNHHIEIAANTEQSEKRFRLIVVDDTIHPDKYIDEFIPRAFVGSRSSSLRADGYMMTYENNALRVDFSMFYHCGDGGYSDPESLHYEILRKEGESLIRLYVVNVEGIYDVIQNVAC